MLCLSRHCGCDLGGFGRQCSGAHGLATVVSSRETWSGNASGAWARETMMELMESRTAQRREIASRPRVMTRAPEEVCRVLCCTLPHCCLAPPCLAASLPTDRQARGGCELIGCALAVTLPARDGLTGAQPRPDRTRRQSLCGACDMKYVRSLKAAED